MAWTEPKEQYERIARIINDTISTKLNRPRIIRAYTGIGKTKTTLKTVSEAGRRWVYVAPYHKTIIEKLVMDDEKTYDFVHLESRNKVCRHPVYKKVMEYDIGISSLCKTCEYYKTKTCEYYQRWNELYKRKCNIACVHSHLSTNTFISYMQENGWLYDVIIIDEVPAEVVLSTIETSTKKLSHLVNQVKVIGMDAENATFFLRVLGDLIDSVEGNKEINYSLFTEVPSGKVSEIYKDYVNRIKNIIISNGVDSINKGAVCLGKEILLAWEAHGSDELKISDSIYYTSYHKRKHVVINRFKGTLEWVTSLGVNVIGLDATASRGTWEFVLGKQCDEVVINRMHENVRTIENSRICQQTWLSRTDHTQISEKGKKLAAIIHSISENEREKVIVACTKKVWDVIVKYFSSMKWDVRKLVFCKYYYQRSRDDYWKQSSCIVICHIPQPPLKQVSCIARLTSSSEELWEDFYTKSEMKQTIGRLRQSHIESKNKTRGDLMIYIFPNLTETNIFDPHEIIEMKRTDNLREFTLDQLLGYVANETRYVLDVLPARERDIMLMCGFNTIRALKKKMDSLSMLGLVMKKDGMWYKVGEDNE